VSRPKRQANAAKPTQRQLVLPLAVDRQDFGAAPAPKAAPSRLNFGAEPAPKNGGHAWQDRCITCTEIGAETAPANKEEEVEQEAEAKTDAAADEFVQRMTKVKPTFSRTEARKLAHQRPDGFRAVLAQLEAADDPEIYSDRRINWCIARGELLSEPTRVPKRDSDDTIAAHLRGYGNALPDIVERKMNLRLRERFRSNGYDGLTADEQAAARDAYRRAEPR
jgi:hypothetical protein